MSIPLDATLRGFPTGGSADEATGGTHFPADGALQLPMITLDGPGFDANTRLMMDHVAGYGAKLAPHAKTPMAPLLAQRLLDAGAWGATVADIRQAAVLLDAGITRLILANGIGGAAAARRLAALLKGYPGAEFHIFVDSAETYEALCAAWDETLPPLGLLVEIGTDRGGIRRDEDALALARRILSEGRLGLSGLAAYEGASAVADPAESQRRIDALLIRSKALFAQIREAAGPEAPLMLSVGGSAWFDRVLALLGDLAQAPNTDLVLRSGALYFHDHGVYERGLADMQKRGGHLEGAFIPTLRLWAEVLSTPEEGLAICGMGLRDVAIDQDLPIALRLWRDGVPVADIGVTVTKLNDQHAFLHHAGLRPGDVIEFGISHPCTCIDRHSVLWELDAAGRVVAAIKTRFG